MILVFGGAGQVGRELERLAANKRIPLEAVPRAVANIADAESVRRQIGRLRPSLIVNAAAFTAVDRAETERDAAALSNTTGAAIVAAACAEAHIPLVHLSTDYVFDGRKSGSYDETDPVSPLGVYGRTKADGEAAIVKATDRHVILRTAWLYGEFGGNFAKTILRLAGERDELRVVNDQHGCPTSTRSLAAAILHISPMVVSDKSLVGIYHFAGAGVTTWHGFASTIVDAQAPLTGKRPKVTAVSSSEFPSNTRRPQNSALNCIKFERAFGLRMRPWEDEAREVVREIVISTRQSERIDNAT